MDCQGADGTGFFDAIKRSLNEVHCEMSHLLTNKSDVYVPQHGGSEKINTGTADSPHPNPWEEVFISFTFKIIRELFGEHN